MKSAANIKNRIESGTLSIIIEMSFAGMPLVESTYGIITPRNRHHTQTDTHALTHGRCSAQWNWKMI